MNAHPVCRHHKRARSPQPSLTCIGSTAFAQPITDSAKRGGRPGARGRGLGLARRAWLAVMGLAVMGLALSTAATAAEPFVYLTNWYAQAEHGGFYQALATGLYAREGLDVRIKMGGPQINLLQMLVAGQADCAMGYDVQTLQAQEQGIHVVTVAAAFQKDPVVIIAHADVHHLEELRGHPILIGQAGLVTYWPWLKGRFGLSDEQMRPYTFSIQPFLADPKLAQQGYLTSEPYTIEHASGIAPSVFLLWDHGWPPYATTIVCTAQTVATKPRQVAAFVKASMLGWKSYLEGDPAPANALIKRDNPNMRDDLIAHAISVLKSQGVVMGGDAARMGIGIVTPTRVKQTYDMMVANHLLDPKKVDWHTAFTTQFVQDLKVLP